MKEPGTAEPSALGVPNALASDWMDNASMQYARVSGAQ